MKRKAIDELIHWKETNYKIPILITGAKGVGKTYLAYDFAKAFFDRICYINFERDPQVTKLFLSFDEKQLTSQLSDYFHLEAEEAMEGRVLILDEISYCSVILSIIKKLDLSKLFHSIICITSTPLPLEYTDYFQHIQLYPLEFDEFLRATSNDWYIESILTHYNLNTKIPDIVHKELLALHQLYLTIGGMPGVINEYLNMSSSINVSELHSSIIGSYHDYILKDNTDTDALKMIQVFDSVTLQLMKENKKFQYKLIRKGTTHSMYKDAIRKLCEGNFVIKCSRLGNEQLTNPALSFQLSWLDFEENNNFKLYLPDTGILNTKMVEEQGTRLNNSHRKALLENYVALSLQSKNYPFAFWESDSMAKVDFIYLKEEELYPIEIFEDENTRSKSISVLKQSCEVPYAIKISARNFEFTNQVKYVPHYAVFCL